MLSFLKRTNNVKLDNADSEVEDLKKELSKAKIEIDLLKSELEKEKSENNKNHEKINSLKWKLEEEREKRKDLENKDYEKLYFSLLELFGFENKNLKNSMINIQNSISYSTKQAKDSLLLSDHVDENFEKAFSNIKIIVQNLDTLLRRSHKVAQVIDELAKRATDIEKFIAQINEVVMQINILSLNASVEAASAGDVGKGFAVVASEVKNLANKTSSVASDIEKVVKTIQLSIENTNNEFQDIDENINEIHVRTKEYNNEIESLHTLTKKSLKELTNLSDSIFINLAKIDHIVWKVNTYDSVYAKKANFEFVDHKNCRLGKWYEEGDGIKYFSKAPSYYKLEKPHSAIHNTTHKVITLLKENDLELNYEKIKDTFAYMEDNSSEVFKILDNILEEISR
jgi:chromosome segregation ATPase